MVLQSKGLAEGLKQPLMIHLHLRSFVMQTEAMVNVIGT